ncbi:MAG TPA: DUF502 domain-containing protein [Stellaceae bacterium]|nr:DUF502 domain-containing protein [Stellaceae bacterium]
MEGLAAPPALEPRRRRSHLMERLRAYFIAGILVTGPIALTLYLVWLFIAFFDGLVAKILPGRYNPETYLPFNVPGLGLVSAVVVLTLIGAATAGYLGRVFLRLSDRIMARMPVVRGVYSAVKQIFETVLAKQSNTFREVVLVEWPRAGMWTVAFVTARLEGEIRENAGPDAVAIYVPTTPNPTSGYLMFVPRRELITLAMSVEEGIKLVISGGIVTPPDRRPRPATPPQIAATGED